MTIVIHFFYHIIETSRQPTHKLKRSNRMSYGYAGKILWVNLTTAECREEPIEKYTQWIGGRGLGSFLVSQISELKSENPADQPIAISAGVLVGTGAPLGSRTTVSARNLVSKGFCYSNVGGDIGTRMKMAGYDTVIIEGKSDQPVYLYLSGSTAKILPADEFWGLKITEFQQALSGRYSNNVTSFIGIGPGGEREAPIACLMVDQAHAAGWGGGGAIFGAKKLKAIVASGNKSIPVFDPAGMKRKIKQLEWRINASERAATLERGGTHGAVGVDVNSPKPVKNNQDEYLPADAVDQLHEENYRQWETGRSGCLGCDIRCLHLYEMESARHGKLEVEGMHFNSIIGFGTNLGVNNAEDVLVMHKLCNEYGLHVDGVTNAVAFALECAENGILEPDQPGGVKLEWGSETLVKLVQQMGERRGLGELLSLGVQEASRQIGGRSEKYAMTIKGVGASDQGMRSHRAWALGIITSTRGAGHLGGSPLTETQNMSAEVGKRIFKNPEAGIPGSYHGKGKLVASTEIKKAIVDSLGLCWFMYNWSNLTIGSSDELAEMFCLATGIEITEEQLHQKGARTHALERYLSYRLSGFTREDDTLSDRFFDTPVSDGPFKGAHLDRSELQAALDEYFEALGWDNVIGVPSCESLREMGMDVQL
jgi:aldehyde:ferredoxin oxidoreductase